MKNKLLLTKALTVSGYLNHHKYSFSLLDIFCKSFTHVFHSSFHVNSRHSYSNSLQRCAD